MEIETERKAKAQAHGVTAPGRIEVVDPFDGYALIDSGGGRKLERFGEVTVERPELQAIWQPALGRDAWARADGVFAGNEEADQGRWKLKEGTAPEWTMEVLGVTALCRFSAFRHLGAFPEQLGHWSWMSDRLALMKNSEQTPRLLNLFGYTGIASLIAARAGAEVTHVDASKKAVEWARGNQERSGLRQAPIRWIVEDARKFVARETRRGRTYHGILLDPPKFGRGPEGEVWNVFEHLPELLAACRSLLASNPNFTILTSYAIRASFLSLDVLMRDLFAGHRGSIVSGELALREESRGRLLSTSLYSRWEGA